VRALWQELGITSVGELEYACRENRLLTLAGFGLATQAKTLEAIEFKRRASEKHHVSTGWEAAEDAAAAVLRADPAAAVAVAGEARRFCEVVAEAVVVCGGVSAGALRTALADLLDEASGGGEAVIGATVPGYPCASSP